MNDYVNHGILMVVGSYHPEVTGGATQCRLLIRALKEKFGFMVLASTRDTELPRRNEVDGVYVTRIPVQLESRVSFFKAFFKFLSFLLNCRKNFRIIHMHGFTTKSVLLLFVSKLFRKKVIVTLTSIGHEDPDSMKARGSFLYHFFSKADMFIGVSKQFEKLYQSSGLPTDRFRLIPNSVDTKRFSPISKEEKVSLREQLGLPLGLKLILFVGHFSREKCPDVLIDAWKGHVADTYVDTGVVFIGATDPGHYEVDTGLVEGIRRSARSHRRERMFFVERTHEIEKYYRTADIYVMPTLREGLPCAMLEAMSCELPVVVSRLEGVTDWVVENGVNGLLISPGNGGELSEALIRLLGDSELSNMLGKKARKTIKKRFRVEEMAGKYEKLYNSSSIN